MAKHVLWCLGAVAALLVFPVQHAQACGGFFCSSAPMNQAGENIVYSVEPSGALEMHVQILYEGSADRFAWILPVPTVPQLGVGTDQLFLALESQTRPGFRTEARVEGECRPDPACPPPPPCTALYCGQRADGGGSFAADTGAASDAGPSVSISFRGVVGPYDAVVLSSGTAAELLTWLRDNGYDIPASSESIIQSYVDAGQYFVALKLVASADTREIQPLVLRFPNQKPCLPVRLTAIATVQNLPITAYFLGSARATPLNYSLAEPSYEDAQLYDTYGSHRPYIDAELDALGGQAFVTEYAGAVPPYAAASIGVPDLSFLRTARSRGDLVRGLSSVLPGDAQLLALLTRLIPPPAGVDARDYFNCLARGFCPYDDGRDAGALDPGPILDALESALVAPRRNAVAMLERHRKLTRLFTTMTAAEMTLDPEFDLDPGLSDVSNEHVSTLVTVCSSERRVSEAPVFREFSSGLRVLQRAARPTVTDSAFCGAIGRPFADADASTRGCSAGSGSTSTPWALATLAVLGLTGRRLRARRAAP